MMLQQMQQVGACTRDNVATASLLLHVACMHAVQHCIKIPASTNDSQVLIARFDLETWQAWLQCSASDLCSWPPWKSETCGLV